MLYKKCHQRAAQQRYKNHQGRQIEARQFLYSKLNQELIVIRIIRLTLKALPPLGAPLNKGGIKERKKKLIIIYSVMYLSCFFIFLLEYLVY